MSIKHFLTVKNLCRLSQAWGHSPLTFFMGQKLENLGTTALEDSQEQLLSIFMSGYPAKSYANPICIWLQGEAGCRISPCVRVCASLLNNYRKKFEGIHRAMF